MDRENALVAAGSRKGRDGSLQHENTGIYYLPGIRLRVIAHPAERTWFLCPTGLFVNQPALDEITPPMRQICHTHGEFDTLIPEIRVKQKQVPGYFHLHFSAV